MDPNTALTPTTGNGRVKVVLPPEHLAKVEEVVRNTPLQSIVGTQVVLFGQGAVDAFSQNLDAFLDQVSKADSPVLYELFRKIKQGVEKMDLPKLEEEIRRRQEGGLFSHLMGMVGLGDKAKQLQEAVDEIRGMVQSKTKTLHDLVHPMEMQIATESQKLVTEINRLGQLAALYRANILELGVYVEAGRQILASAKEQLASVEAEVQDTDPVKVQDVKEFRTKVELFENRLLTLETSYAKAPVDLESVGISQSASLMTLADTISSAQAEFNDIKSALLRLQATFQIRSIQQLNDQRRLLRSQLQKYSIQQLETAAVTATASAADAQLANAELLVEVAAMLGNISNKVDAERQKNVGKMATARDLLSQAQQAVSVLNQPHHAY